MDFVEEEKEWRFRTFQKKIVCKAEFCFKNLVFNGSSWKGDN